MAVSIIMAFLDGLDKSLQLQNMLDAFVYYKGPGGPTELFEQTRNPVDFAKKVVFVLQALLGDGVLVSMRFSGFENTSLRRTAAGISLSNGL